MIILTQVFLGLIFLFLSLVSFTLVGLWALKKIKINVQGGAEKFVLSSVFGLVLFTLSAYILAALNLRFSMWIFPIFGFYIFLKNLSELTSLIPKVSHKGLFLLVFLIGIIGQVAVNAPSGFPYQDGIYFYSSHGHDGIWHIALMEHMQKNIFPFQNPDIAGQQLQNYHFFVDLLMSEFVRLFNFSSLDVYFRFMPMVFSILLGLSSFVLIKNWSKSEIAGIWAIFFTYFVGSFGYLLYFPTHKTLGGESIFWVSQTQSVLGNPPHAAAFIIVTVFLFCLFNYLKTKSKGYFFLCSILGGAVIEFKVYAGVLILGGLLILGFYELLKRSFKTLALFLATLLISLMIYLPNSANSQDFLIWHPWWFIRTMVVAPDRLNWLDLELRRQTYIAENNWKRVIQLEVTAFLIFLIGNLGMRILGSWFLIKMLKEFRNPFNLFFLSITIISFFIPVFFLQKGVAWNAIQFNQYFLLLFGFLAALSMPHVLDLFKRKELKIIFSILVILLAIPTQLGLLRQFYANPPLSKISYFELEALNFLKKQEGVTILTAPFNVYEKDKFKNPPIPIYAWYDTGYVAAFTNNPTLISDEEQITILGYDANSLIKHRNKAFASDDPQKMNDFLKMYNIDYIYLVWNQKFAVSSDKLNADMIFINQDAKVFKVRK